IHALCDHYASYRLCIQEQISGLYLLVYRQKLRVDPSTEGTVQRGLRLWREIVLSNPAISEHVLKAAAQHLTGLLLDEREPLPLPWGDTLVAMLIATESSVALNHAVEGVQAEAKLWGHSHLDSGVSVEEYINLVSEVCARIDELRTGAEPELPDMLVDAVLEALITENRDKILTELLPPVLNTTPLNVLGTLLFDLAPRLPGLYDDVVHVVASAMGASLDECVEKHSAMPVTDVVALFEQVNTILEHYTKTAKALRDPSCPDIAASLESRINAEFGRFVQRHPPLPIYTSRLVQRMMIAPSVKDKLGLESAKGPLDHLAGLPVRIAAGLPVSARDDFFLALASGLGCRLINGQSSVTRERDLVGAFVAEGLSGRFSQKFYRRKVEFLASMGVCEVAATYGEGIPTTLVVPTSCYMILAAIPPSGPVTLSQLKAAVSLPDPLLLPSLAALASHAHPLLLVHKGGERGEAVITHNRAFIPAARVHVTISEDVLEADILAEGEADAEESLFPSDHRAKLILYKHLKDVGQMPESELLEYCVTAGRGSVSIEDAKVALERALNVFDFAREGVDIVWED
ncbi:hypothetical protein KIPB_003571, partial [Kipferlia bialata]